MARWQKAWNGLAAAVPWGVRSQKGCCQTAPIFGNCRGWWFHYPSSETSSFAEEGIFQTEPIFRVSQDSHFLKLPLHGATHRRGAPLSSCQCEQRSRSQSPLLSWAEHSAASSTLPDHALFCPQTWQLRWILSGVRYCLTSKFYCFFLFFLASWRFQVVNNT